VRFLLVSILVAVVGACATDVPSVAPSSAIPSPEPSAVVAPTQLVTPAPAVTPRPTAAPSALPTATPAKLVPWEDIGSLEASSEDSEFGVVGFAKGYVVTWGEDAQVAYSADGISWRTTKLKVKGGTVLDVGPAATDGQHVVLMGRYSSCSRRRLEADETGLCGSRPTSWISDDGRQWLGGVGWNGRQDPHPSADSTIYAVWAVAPERWEAAQVIYNGTTPGDPGGPTGPALWRSRDGLHWSLVSSGFGRVKSVCPKEDWWPEDVAVWASVRGVRLLSVPCPDRSLAMSKNGRTYTLLKSYPGRAPDEGLAPIGTSRWIFVSGTAGWTTDDLAAWASFQLPTSTTSIEQIVGIVHGDIGYVIAGNDDGGSDEEPGSVTWTSEDATEWHIAALSDQISQLVAGPAGVLGFFSGGEAIQVRRLVEGAIVEGAIDTGAGGGAGGTGTSRHAQ